MEKAIEAVKGSFLADVLGFIGKGVFPSVGAAVKENEEVIGDMSLFEKGLLAYADFCGKKEEELVEQLNKMKEKNEQESPEFKPKHNELKTIRENFEISNELMWNSIRGRFGVWDCGTGIRDGYKVIKMSKNLLGAGFPDLGGISIIHVSLKD
ncbi:MAG TPA: hypothetical protein P5548_00945 [Candidatus Moranbacteria bacterium]|nr:hypothetical protein [Candidatus Moranbacteria bacterium]HRZ33459.1 hypothetical protein [Candidatus Moranbacteria bacterium]